MTMPSLPCPALPLLLQGPHQRGLVAAAVLLAGRSMYIQEIGSILPTGLGDLLSGQLVAPEGAAVAAAVGPLGLQKNTHHTWNNTQFVTLNRFEDLCQ